MAVSGVGQADQEEVVRFQEPRSGKTLLDQGALAGRRGIEVGVEPRRGAAVKAAHRRDIGDDRGRVENLKLKPVRSHPGKTLVSRACISDGSAVTK